MQKCLTFLSKGETDNTKTNAMAMTQCCILHRCCFVQPLYHPPLLPRLKV
jgi:hypothetical protein